MSSLPLILNLIDELDRESYNPSYYGNDFGFGLHPSIIHRLQEKLQPEPKSSHLVGYSALPLCLRSRRGVEKKGEGPVSAVGKDGFQVCMDVAQFKPNELSVKVVDNHVVVEGKHEEREDNHGFITRHFVRRYNLPKGYDADRVISTLSSDGVLTVSVPKPQIEEKSNERIVQIQQTGPAHLNVKENTSDKKAEIENGAKGDGVEKK